MYVIIIYDINTKRVNKVHKYLKTYLTWIQNSVFEGEITKSQYQTITTELKTLIDEEKDSIIIYEIPEKYLNRTIIGYEKNPMTMIL
ncbi:CRISPR-associated endonuclease Cas2 [Methanosphaera sp. ISO3-F5]|uniref:CRISPR-associated endonuclease Cas2 n=1 Tax=Methanosphaera sp. ISO3-F5 TaxID=1452353 RepID=UPI002B25A3FB|nr:CRISPR-associated endonuclease Cas2 [Methanosphaera sp. ISO3-F5]WQH63647.1 CRISPR-associated endonuclease Cas2 [Methanosphaera sp. ISO3-F5]